MVITDITNLIIGEEYALVDRYDNITVAYFRGVEQYVLNFFDDKGQRTYVCLGSLANYHVYDDSTSHANQQADVYCVYPTEDYLQDQAIFRYSQVLKEPSALACLVGKTFTKVCQQYGGIHFETPTATATLAHRQICCESVWLEDVNGDLKDLEGAPILRAEEKKGGTAAQSWVFYTLATKKGYVDLRFCAEQPTMYSTDATLSWFFKKQR